MIMINHNIAHSTSMKKLVHRSDFGLTTDTPYLPITGNKLTLVQVMAWRLFSSNVAATHEDGSIII